MMKKRYQSPIFMSESGGNPTIIGNGSGQGTNAPEGISYEEWWSVIALEGTNIDADYNQDGSVDENDYKYYVDNKLWLGEE